MISHWGRGGKTDEIRVVFAETGYEKQGSVCVHASMWMWCQRSTQHHDIQRLH